MGFYWETGMENQFIHGPLPDCVTTDNTIRVITIDDTTSNISSKYYVYLEANPS